MYTENIFYIIYLRMKITDLIYKINLKDLNISYLNS